MNFGLLSILLLFVVSSNGYANRSYIFAIVPQQPPGKLIASWAPVIHHLELESGVNLRLGTKRNIPTFEEACASADFDFVYMNPVHYINFHKEAGYTSIAKARDNKIRGIVVVRKDSPVKKLQELDGKKLAFPSRGAFAASLIPRSVLKKLKIQFTPKYVGSHDVVYNMVADGDIIAGGGVMRTLATTLPAVQNQLRILWTSEAYTPHAFAAHARVPESVVKKIQAALIGMDQSEHGKELLEKLKIKGIEAAQDSDWNDIRNLDIY